jgi:hypothetical protein
VLPWGWIRNALRQLAQSGQYDWLTIRHAGNDLVIGVGEIPVRFFIDHHLNPRKARVLSPTEGEAAQLVLPFAQMTDSDPALWRFIVERALSDQDENRVFFVGYNIIGEIVAKWEFTETVRTFRSTDSDIPEAAQLGPIPLTPIFPQDDAANDSINAAGNGDEPRGN